ncbi:MAG: 3-hydroxyacyl-CoA dehydrogenase family protein [bacterium]
MSIKTIAIIGAGVMGSDVALDLACHNLKVILKDINDDILEKSKERIKETFRMVQFMKKEFKDISLNSFSHNLHFTTEYKGFEQVDLVIENITEEWSVKKRVYQELKDICTSSPYYAVNTSCISITLVASLLPAPDKVIGVHFMNPVPLKKMVETIRGFHTSKETEEVIVEFLKSIGKNPIVVNDLPGFVANRLSHLFMNEAAFLVQDQVATPAKIDIIFKQAYGHKMGPLETADLIGLDTVVKSLEVLYESYQDPKFRCCPLLKKMVHAGLLGKKSGKGFYEYK